MTKKISETRTVEEFQVAVVEYCDVLDQFEKFPASEFLEHVFIILQRMILMASTLPEIKRFTEYEVTHLSHDEWQLLDSSLKAYLGKYDTYFQVADSYDEEDREPIQMSLAGDLSEIYQELQPSLIAFNNCSSQDKLSIIWVWKLLFKSHWGDHATRAVRTLYSLLYYNQLLEESKSEWQSSN